MKFIRPLFIASILLFFSVVPVLTENSSANARTLTPIEPETPNSTPFFNPGLQIQSSNTGTNHFPDGDCFSLNMETTALVSKKSIYDRDYRLKTYITYHYSELNLLDHEVHYDRNGDVILTVQYIYNSDNMLTRINCYNALNTLQNFSIVEYDKTNNPLRKTSYSPEGDLLTYITYSYDDPTWMPLKSKTEWYHMPDNSPLGHDVFIYDNHGKITRIVLQSCTGNTDGTFTFKYFSNGNLKTKLYLNANNVMTQKWTYFYTKDNRLMKITNHTQTNSKASDRIYTYDNEGRLITINTFKKNNTFSGRITFTYNSL